MQIILTLEEKRERHSKECAEISSGLLFQIAMQKTHTRLAEYRQRFQKYPSGLHFADNRFNIKGYSADVNRKKKNFDHASG